MWGLSVSVATVIVHHVGTTSHLPDGLLHQQSLWQLMWCLWMNHRQQLFRGSFAIILLVTKFGQLTRRYPGFMRVDHQDAVVINYIVMENGFWYLKTLLEFRENFGRSPLKEVDAIACRHRRRPEPGG